MILEKSNRLNIAKIIPFRFETQPSAVKGGESYPGDSGRVFDLTMDFGKRSARILLFDSDFGREELLTGRFIYGRKARSIYRTCCLTTARVLEMSFPEVLGYIERCREHRILRAGEVMSLTPFIEGLKSQGDDFKRFPVDGGDLYRANASSPINWGPETTRIFSDVCPATGGTLEAFVHKAIEETNLERLVINCSTSTLNALNRVIPEIPENIEVTVICWEALFSVWREDITLPDGEKILAGTVINLNPDNEKPQNNPLAPKEVIDYIHGIFQRDKVKILPDVAGEVGEKVQENWLGPVTYDILEFYTAGMNLSESPWREKVDSAWNLPGVQEFIKTRLPYIYDEIRAALGDGNHPDKHKAKTRAGENAFALL